jgi:micrococcal nuclease
MSAAILPIVPGVAARWRDRGALVAGLATVVTFGGCAADPAADSHGAPPRTAATTTTTTVTATTTTTTTVAMATTTAAASASAVPPSVAVRSVTDGDTIVLADGRRVRLAQVDAPEDTSRRECYGPESTAALERLVGGKSVSLRRPPNGPATDRYGRTLAELHVDGASVNEALVRDGAAEWYEEFEDEDADLGRRLQAAEDEARRAGRGLWSACHASAQTQAAQQARPGPPATTTAPAPAGGCHPAYPDDCIPPAPPDLDCPDIGRRVRVDHAHGDPHGLDADRDGWGCESYG